MTETTVTYFFESGAVATVNRVTGAVQIQRMRM